MDRSWKKVKGSSQGLGWLLEVKFTDLGIIIVSTYRAFPSNTRNWAGWFTLIVSCKFRDNPMKLILSPCASMGKPKLRVETIHSMHPPHPLQVKVDESGFECKAVECQCPYPSTTLTGEKWKMWVVMMGMSPSGGMKRATEEGVGGSHCLSGNRWWAHEERNGIHHGATSWLQYENFKKPGDPNWGMPLVASVWRKAHYQGETTETTWGLRLVVPLLGMCWTLVGLQCLLFQGICFRACSLWSQRVNCAKWYIHSSDLPLLKTCCSLSVLPHSTNTEWMPFMCQVFFSTTYCEHWLHVLE